MSEFELEITLRGRIAALEVENDNLRAKLKALCNLLGEDFPHGPDAENYVTPEYAKAYREAVALTANGRASPST